MFLLVAAAAALAATSALAASALRLEAVPSFLLAAYLLAFGEIVLLTELLSPFHAVSKAGYLGGEALVLLLSVAVWQRRGQPRPPRPAWRAGALRRHPVVAALGAVVGAALVYQLVVGLTTPPNNWDSMTYHLTRVAEWLQRGGVEYFHAAAERANASQPGAEMVLLWTIVFPHRDTAAALPQLVAEVVALVAVYGIARRLGYERAPSAFATLLTATLTQVALQSVTTQNDLIGAALIAAAAYFALGAGRTELALAATAFALAMGVKLTAVYALPLLLALLVIRRGLRAIPAAAVATAAAIALFAVYGYALNFAETGRVLGRPSVTVPLQPTPSAGGTVSTASRVVWRFIDVSGYHPHTTWTGHVGTVGRRLFDGLGIAANPPKATTQQFEFVPNSGSSEDISFFGPLGILLVLPLSVSFLVLAAWRRTGLEKGVLALALPLYALEIAFTYRYNGWLGRFLVAPVLLTMPLAAAVYTRRTVAAIAALIGAVTLAVGHTFNQARPTGFDRTTAVWSLSRLDAQTLRRPSLRPVFAAVGVEGARLGNPPLGVLAGEDDWTYPLYGTRFERRLVVLPPGSTLDDAAHRGLRWLVVGEGGKAPAPAAGWLAERFAGSSWTLFTRQLR